MIFLQNKKILNLCFRLHFLRSYRFVAEVTFKLANIYVRRVFVPESIENLTCIIVIPQKMTSDVNILLFIKRSSEMMQ